MIFVFLPLAAALVYFSWRSLAGGIEYLRFFKRELARGSSDFAPPATVFVPCRGLDEGLAENLAPILVQDYPRYEVLFIVDSESDEAVPVIRRLLSGHEIPARIVVSGAAHRESQKVHNLRIAVAEASAWSEAFVFIDSDVRPARRWLRDLVAPLADETVGCATGYRWFISPRPGFASAMRSVWNASIASALGPKTEGNFCWGGSTAIRRTVFEKIGMAERWRGTLSDDFALTRAMNDAKLPIVFVPRALTASVEGCTLAGLFEFTTRQMKITRVYAPHLWKMSFIGSALFTIVMVSAMILVAISEFGGFSSISAIATLALVSTFSIGKSALRLKAVELALDNHRNAIRGQWMAHCLFWALSPPLFLWNSTAALISRLIIWRGIRYELRSPTETVVVGPMATNRR